MKEGVPAVDYSIFQNYIKHMYEKDYEVLEDLAQKELSLKSVLESLVLPQRLGPLLVNTVSVKLSR